MKFSRLHTQNDILDLFKWHSEHSDFAAIDVETTSVHPRQAELIDVQISGREEDEAVIFSGNQAKLLLELAPRVILVAHHYRYDAHVLYKHGVDLLDRTWRDTMLLGHLVDENRESYSLDSYVQEYYNDPFKEAFWETYNSYQEAPPEAAMEYACKDAVYDARLYKRLVGELVRQAIPDSLVTHVHRLQASLLRTEIQGIKVDLDFLLSTGIEMKAKIESLKPQMRDAVNLYCELWEMEEYDRQLSKRKTEAGKRNVPQPTFSFDSSKQLQDLLYNKLGLPVQKDSKTKRPSTGYESLLKIKDSHPIIPLILDYGSLPRIYSTYIEGVQNRLDQGRIYPEFHMADDHSGMKTSRISHRNPNTGNMPSYLKGIYAPDEGELFSEHDYSQLEVCVEAHYTQDPNLLKIVHEGVSKHDITSDALKIERPTAKTVNFLMQYRGSHFKLAKVLGISEKEAQYVWNKYWETYAGCRKLQQEVDAKIQAGEPIVDWFGRKRRFEHRKYSPWDKALRQGYNFLIQSTGGQLMNNSFYRADEHLRKLKRGKGVLTVHDSGLFGHKAAYCSEDSPIVAGFMVNEGVLARLTVPLKVDSKAGGIRWGDYA